jgi:hypothetical protein
MNDETQAAFDQLAALVMRHAPEHAPAILTAAADLLIAATRHMAAVATEAVREALKDTGK